MSRAWCSRCKAYKQIGDDFKKLSRMDRIAIGNVYIEYEDVYTKCPDCGDAVWTNELVDECTHNAHEAYIKAKEESEVL